MRVMLQRKSHGDPSGQLTIATPLIIWIQNADLKSAMAEGHFRVTGAFAEGSGVSRPGTLWDTERRLAGSHERIGP